MQVKKIRREGLIKNTIKNKGLLFMALPAIVLIFMFNYMPLFGLVVAFKNFDYSKGLWLSDWVGLKNFSFLLVSKDITIRIIRNTVLYWTMFTAVGIVGSVTIAIIINECRSKYLAKISHTIMIFPTFISWIAVAFVVKALLDSQSGMLNHFLTLFGQQPIQWYTESKLWPMILLITQVWKTMGYGAIIYLSALSGVDNSLYEAAELDGASKWQQIWNITLPMLTPLISINTLLSLGGIMHSNTGLFYQVTRNLGILYPTTQTIDAYVMNSLVSGTNDFGLTSSITFFQSIIGCFMVIVTNWIIRNREADNALF